MTVSKIREKLEEFEKEGFGNLELKIQIYNTTKDTIGIEKLSVQGSGINSSAEKVTIIPQNDLWFA